MFVCVCVYTGYVLCMSFMCLSIVCECGLCVCVAHAYAHLCVFREARRGLQYPALSHLPCSFETWSLSEPGASFLQECWKLNVFMGVKYMLLS